VIAEFSFSVTEFAISGEPTPAKFSNKLLNEFEGDEMVIEPTFNVCGKLAAVFWLMATAFHPAFVKKMVWLVPGNMPNDQEESCQYPLPGEIQLLVWAMEGLAIPSSPLIATANDQSPTSPKYRLIYK
jgi:hypothetical protein